MSEYITRPLAEKIVDHIAEGLFHTLVNNGTGDHREASIQFTCRKIDEYVAQCVRARFHLVKNEYLQQLTLNQLEDALNSVPDKTIQVKVYGHYYSRSQSYVHTMYLTARGGGYVLLGHDAPMNVGELLSAINEARIRQKTKALEMANTYQELWGGSALSFREYYSAKDPTPVIAVEVTPEAVFLMPQTKNSEV